MCSCNECHVCQQSNLQETLEMLCDPAHTDGYEVVDDLSLLCEIAVRAPQYAG